MGTATLGQLVQTPFVEPTGDNANHVRKKDGTTFTWEKESTSSGVPGAHF